jgi:hypothetical protein
MTFYQLVVFLHVLGAFGLFAALGIEWAAVAPLRRATDPEEAQPWIKLLASLARVTGPSAATLLVTGVYMGSTLWGRQAWIGLSLLGLVLIAGLGAAVTGRRLAAIGRESARGSLSGGPLRLRLQDPVLVLSLRMRTAVATGIAFLMTTKPPPEIALSATLAAVVVGLAWAMPAFGRGRPAGVETAP